MKAFLFLFIFTLCGLSFSQSNSIQNGGFEDALNNWSLLNTDVGSSVSIDNTIFNQGMASARLEINNVSEKIVSGLTQSFTILPNTTYLFSYDIKTTDVNYIAYPYFKFSNGTDNYISTGYASGRTKNWTTYSMRVTTPSNVYSLEFYFFLYGNIGTAWIDSVSLTEITTSNQLTFSVNTSIVTNVFNTKLISTNSSPIRPGSPTDLTNGFQEIGIPEVRTHDIYNTCDIHSIFPDMNADPLNPSSYNFSETDIVIQSIINSGATPLFRLGESYSINQDFNSPPVDFDKWSTVCLQIVKHYNDGWNNGFNFNINKWEIWNEPDLYEFWAGTPEEFYNLYNLTVTKLKNFDTTLKVGMSGFAVTSSNLFIEPILTLIISNNTPLDFISYHKYSNSNPYFFKLQEQDFRELLSSYNLNDVETYLTEWNNYSYSEENTLNDYGRDDALSAALTASSIYYLQNSTLNAAYRYRSDEYYFGLFRDDGNLSYSGMAFKAIGSFINTNQIIETIGNDTLGTNCLAGKSTDNNQLTVLISNPTNECDGYTINIENLEADYNYEIKRIDNNNEFIVISSGIVSPTSNTITNIVAPPFVELITFEKTLSTDDFIVFPNPCQGAFQVFSENSNIVKIELVDALGQVIQNPIVANSKSVTVNTSNIASGIYFIKITTSTKKEILKKIVIE